ncbi:galactose oxidase/kelch repeat superfamily protein isoform X2 [Wolffia australiana]
MEESTCQALIPGLPDELALLCLAQISHGHHGALECVSRRWRDALRSDDYARIKARERLCGDWLFVLTDETTPAGWRAYDPSADRWRPLPRTSAETSHHGFGCAALDGRLLVLGGCTGPSSKGPTSRVLGFDPCTCRWTELAPMATPRANFACAVLGGRVFVAGGCASTDSEGLAAAEAYDPLRNKWEGLPEMPVALEACWGLSQGRRFHVVSWPWKHVVFDPASGSWEVGPAGWELERPDPGLAAAALDGRVYGVLDEGLAVLEPWSGRWKLLGEPPLFKVPSHGRRIRPSGGALAALRGWVYMVGGKGIAYDADTCSYNIVKFDCALRCRPGDSGPIRWLDARPLFRASGSVVGCAALHQPTRIPAEHN